MDISLEGKRLLITGKRNEPELGDEDTYIRKERVSGDFSRTINLPYSVEPDKVKAEYKNGILTVKLPKAEAEKSRAIKITA